MADWMPSEDFLTHNGRLPADDEAALVDDFTLLQNVGIRSFFDDPYGQHFMDQPFVGGHAYGPSEPGSDLTQATQLPVQQWSAQQWDPQQHWDPQQQWGLQQQWGPQQQWDLPPQWDPQQQWVAPEQLHQPLVPHSVAPPEPPMQTPSDTHTTTTQSQPPSGSFIERSAPTTKIRHKVHDGGIVKRKSAATKRGKTTPKGLENLPPCCRKIKPESLKKHRGSKAHIKANPEDAHLSKTRICGICGSKLERDDGLHRHMLAVHHIDTRKSSSAPPGTLAPSLGAPQYPGKAASGFRFAAPAVPTHDASLKNATTLSNQRETVEEILALFARAQGLPSPPVSEHSQL
ncbi:hypothetical protein BV25DRAFT_282066 [Artomyces pyxidatus]|uniref:Uncharacterized protein n=1 Tax=Artomyces pyxidatus TaxID=48021 RepID=A0ACB8T8G4_9AGAM|nr:hypothetical protein BV25DRAFT_282066 [Artomyces pyxidatus]